MHPSISFHLQVFIELVIQNVSRHDSLAIVSFSDDAEIEFPMTKMNETSKVSVESASEVVSINFKKVVST